MRAGFPRPWLLASLTACSCALAAAGCGSSEQAAPGPRLPRALAQRLAGEADAVAARYRAGNPCAAQQEALRLQRETTQAINAGEVPAAFQEELQGVANSLADRISCVRVKVEPAPSPPVQAKGHEKRGKKHGKKHEGEGGED